MPRLAVPGFLALSAALALAANAHAQVTADPQDRGGVIVQMAGGPRALRATLGWETPVLWTHQAPGGPGRVELTGEFGVSYWGATHAREPASMWQLSAIPMLRWWPGGGRFFVEGGIGPTLVNRTHFAGEDISTAFQFGDHLGMGYQFTPAIRASLRLSHFSNADIKQPNPGFNLLQLTCTYLY
ncbi:MAG: acyloxyacyl hydrolase [Rhodoferax sp.]|nr:acyloxyacyl hydrolase [Rhodoferax sp.]